MIATCNIVLYMYIYNGQNYISYVANQLKRQMLLQFQHSLANSIITLILNLICVEKSIVTFISTYHYNILEMTLLINV